MRSRWLVVVALLAAVVRVGNDAQRLLGNPTRYWNWEESYNAAVGYYAWTAGLWDQLLRLQQKSFCGGCTVVGLLAAPSLGMFGDHLWAWKLVPLAWTVATLFVGAGALKALVGDAAALAWLVLFAVPPPGVSELGLMAWGNHAESTIFVLGALWATARQRYGIAAFLLGFGVWFCRTSAYAALVLVPLLSVRGGRAGAVRTLGGVALGLLPLALPAAAGDAGGYDLGIGSLLAPDGWAGVVARARAVGTPLGFGGRAFPAEAHPELLGGVVLAAVALGLLLALRRLPAALLLAYAGLFCVSGFDVAKVGNAAPVLNLRYHAPLLHLMLLVVATGAGVAWGRGRAWRVFAVAVTLGMLVPSAVGQAAHRREAEEVADARVIPHVHFASMAAGRLTPERIASAHAEDPVVEATLRRMEGFRLGAEVRGGRALEEAAAAAPGAAALEGIGQALVDGQGWRDLPGWYPRWAALPAGQARSIARGAAWNLGIALELGGPRRVGAAAVADALRLSRQGVPEGQPCAVCAAAGYAAMKACRGEGASCLVEVSEGPDAAEVLYGAGVACPTAGTVDPRCDRIASELPAALAAAFTAGMRDPMAGADAPVRITAR